MSWIQCFKSHLVFFPVLFSYSKMSQPTGSTIVSCVACHAKGSTCLLCLYYLHCCEGFVEVSQETVYSWLFVSLMDHHCNLPKHTDKKPLLMRKILCVLFQNLTDAYSLVFCQACLTCTNTIEGKLRVKGRLGLAKVTDCNQICFDISSKARQRDGTGWQACCLFTYIRHTTPSSADQLSWLLCPTASVHPHCEFCFERDNTMGYFLAE